MDDMKKLVERYKQELMEYSKVAKAAAPPKKLEFPEMTEEQPQPTKSERPIWTETPKKPEIIGYADNGDLMSAFSDMFVTGDMSSETTEESVFDEPDTDGEEYIEPVPDLVEEMPPEEDNSFDEEDNGVSTVTPEETEEIGDIPESGQSPEEQLGKRDFEEQTPVRNSREDIRPLRQSGNDSPVAEERSYSSVQEFNDANTRKGTVRFVTYTARGALPVPNANVVVSKRIGGEPYILYTLTTDMSGQTPIISLPAPPKELSIAPDSKITPYATYNAEVTAAGFNDVLISNMPVFEGVLSVQRIALVPDVGQQLPEVIAESEPQLNGGV